jgi:hypothetical protein
MKRKLWWGLALGLTGTTLLAGALVVAQTPQTRVDVGKYVIERPTEMIFGGQPPADAAGADRGKYIIERPTEKVLAGLPPADAPPAAPAADLRKEQIELPTKKVAADAAPGDDNPKCEPGKVKWHPDVETACKAALLSGKPVLVFHMMGKLDDRFC